ncbi:unnamed protein product [Symbiodinium sp. CCMP2592]|nr:unnamed protein product [Symbiodinium sp. CCMP2592]
MAASAWIGLQLALALRDAAAVEAAEGASDLEMQSEAVAAEPPDDTSEANGHEGPAPHTPTYMENLIYSLRRRVEALESEIASLRSWTRDGFRQWEADRAAVRHVLDRIGALEREVTAQGELVNELIDRLNR